MKMPYVVEKQGFNDSAAIFKTKQEAVKDGQKYYPGVPFKVEQITKEEATVRWVKYLKRLQGKVPAIRIKDLTGAW